MLYWSRSRGGQAQKQQSLKEYFKHFESEGTVFGAVNKNGFATIPFLIPPPTVVEKFESVAFPIDRRIEINEKESRTLAAIRNTLLPKRISGELQAPEVERMAEEALLNPTAH